MRGVIPNQHPTRAQIAARKLIERDEALADIKQYRLYMSKSGHLDFVYTPARHHEILQEHLQALIDGEIRRLMIFLPPGAAKSTYSSIQAATWFMAKNPTKNILACSNTQDLAENFNRRRRQVIETPEWQLLAGTGLDPQNKGVARFGTLQGGNCMAAGAGSSITGLRSDFNLADDLIVGHEQANSPTQLDKLWSWYIADFRSRLKPRCPEAVIMTRWSSADIAGRLLDAEGDTWTVVRMPMECDDPDNDPLDRDLGDRLWPEWFEDERIDEFKRNPRDWTSLFQQKPVDEKGTWMPAEHFHTEKPPKHLNIVIGIDIALSIQGGDFTVMAVCGVDEHRNIHLVDLYRDQVSTDVSARKLLELCETYKPSRCMIDDDNASKVWTKYVFDLGRQSGVMPPLQLRKTMGQDKETRAASLRGYLLSDSFYVNDKNWAHEVYNEFLNFPSHGTHDDIVDACALVAREMMGNSAPHAPRKSEAIKLEMPIVQTDEGPVLRMGLNQLFNEHDAKEKSVKALYKW